MACEAETAARDAALDALNDKITEGGEIYARHVSEIAQYQTELGLAAGLLAFAQGQLAACQLDNQQLPIVPQPMAP